MDQAVEQSRVVAVQIPSYQGAWEYVLSQLRGEMARADYDSYVSTLKPLSFKEGIFRVGARSSYTRDWATTRLRVKVSKLLELVLSQKVDVHFALITGDDRHGWVEMSLPLAAAEIPEVESPASASETLSAANIENGSPAKPAAAPVVPATHASVVDAALALEAPQETVATEIIDRPANGNGAASGRKKKAELAATDQASPRKIQLQRAYGTERARVVQPERGMFLTLYFFNNWLPLLGHSAMTTIIAARTLCYWNPLTGELRNVVETDMAEIARRAAVSVRTVKDVLNDELIKKYFLRYKVRRVMTPNGVRTAGIILQVRMDDPLTPEDQDEHNLPEDERWYTADFEDEQEE